MTVKFLTHLFTYKQGVILTKQISKDVEDLEGAKKELVGTYYTLPDQELLSLTDVKQVWGDVIVVYSLCVDETFSEEDWVRADADAEPLFNYSYSKILEKIIRLDSRILSTLMPGDFVLSDLYKLYLHAKPEMDKANFYRLIRKTEHIIATGETTKSQNHRPAKIYNVGLIVEAE